MDSMQAEEEEAMIEDRRDEPGNLPWTSVIQPQFSQNKES
jgi:hypothetical protein